MIQAGGPVDRFVDGAGNPAIVADHLFIALAGAELTDIEPNSIPPGTVRSPVITINAVIAASTILQLKRQIIILSEGEIIVVNPVRCGAMA